MIARILAAILLFSLVSLTGGPPVLAAQISVSGAGLAAPALRRRPRSIRNSSPACPRW